MDDQDPDDFERIVGPTLRAAPRFSRFDDDEVAAYIAGGMTPAEPPTFEARLAADTILETPVDLRRMTELLDAPAPPTPEPIAPPAAEPPAAIATPHPTPHPTPAPLAARLRAPLLRLEALMPSFAPLLFGALVVVLAVSLWPRGPARLPSYAIEGPFGGHTPERGPTRVEALPKFRAGTPIRIVLRPERAVDVPVEAHFIVVAKGTRRVAPTDVVSVDERGVVRLETTARVLFDRSGFQTVYAVLGATPEDPLQAPLDTLQLQIETAGGQWLATRLEYRR